MYFFSDILRLNLITNEHQTKIRPIRKITLCLFWLTTSSVSCGAFSCGLQNRSTAAAALADLPRAKSSRPRRTENRLSSLSHRLTSGLAFIAVLVFLIWAFRRFPKATRSENRLHRIHFYHHRSARRRGFGFDRKPRRTTLTAARPFWMIGHLTNTFILLAFPPDLTAWFAGRKTVWF